ncbi:MAG: phosphoribosyl-ATP diphosphatase [Gammaproteobacteria bacterium]|nr:phosphoribosyl-ATP diphosphatase [Gammaproteobacteria bacterium]
MADIIKRIADVLEQRKSAGAGESYSASLYRKGDDAILAKIAEEAGELIEAAGEADGTAGDAAARTTDEAAREEQRQRILHEMADLWFHCQVLLAHKNITVEELLAELERRFGTSGHEEKRRRGE